MTHPPQRQPRPAAPGYCAAAGLQDSKPVNPNDEAALDAEHARKYPAPYSCPYTQLRARTHCLQVIVTRLWAIKTAEARLSVSWGLGAYERTSPLLVTYLPLLFCAPVDLLS